MYARITASQSSALLVAVLLYQLNNAARLKPPKRCQRPNSQLRPASPFHQARYTRASSEPTMAEEKKSRACHYLQPQEWWFADKTPIESVFLMMYGARRPYAVDATRLHQTISHTGPAPRR